MADKQTEPETETEPEAIEPALNPEPMQTTSEPERCPVCARLLTDGFCQHDGYQA